ncbi:MAG: hypothetical protein LBH08_02770 [Puniceicoccales bacterium]|jgi:hypothetical protein|nr:hypothetical protein [Puniceicoccales bacterium]
MERLRKNSVKIDGSPLKNEFLRAAEGVENHNKVGIWLFNIRAASGGFHVDTVDCDRADFASNGSAVADVRASAVSKLAVPAKPI